MPREQIAMGLGVAGLSLLALYRSVWLLSSTRKGQWLAHRLGPLWGLRALRILCIATALFGLALAGGWINPVKWGE